MEKNQYHPLEQIADVDVENVREINNVPQEENTTYQLRQSRRLQTASNKYLEAIKAKLQDSDTE